MSKGDPYIKVCDNCNAPLLTRDECEQEMCAACQAAEAFILDEEESAADGYKEPSEAQMFGGDLYSGIKP